MIKPVPAGELRTPATIKAPTVVRDTHGGETVTWNIIATVWARVWEGGGSEFFASHNIKASKTAQITIRFRSDIRAKWRLQVGNDVYDIHSIKNMEHRNVYLELMCAAVQS